MNKNELKEILKDHELWLRGMGGNQADLQKADLQGADLREANLQGADLREANLDGANLQGADLREANLQGADLRGANLQGADLWAADLRGANLQGADLREANLDGANLQGADLREANLQGADLREANLQGADLREANLDGANLQGADLREANLQGADLRGAYLWHTNIDGWQIDYRTIGVHPAPEGDLIVWGKKNGILVKMLVPVEARRSCATTRKHRAEYVKVLEVIGADEAVVKNRFATTIYRSGEIIHCHEWDDDRWNECSGGIHFFLTREEAENW